MDYDIKAAFDRIEHELLMSMMRNMKKHRAWEEAEGFQWEQWQALQLKALKEYKKKNSKKYGKEFEKINIAIETVIRNARAQGNMDQELELLEMIKSGKFKKPRISKKQAKLNAEFFKLNDRKLDALIKATISDMEKAETAVLRMANDKYRQIIFDAQVYSNTGAGTYEQAVDMATKDFLSAGLNCIEYKNGARHTISDYASMALRTASKRAYLTGEGEKRKEWGISTVIMNKRGNPCPKCLPWVGKVLIDDVWSGGSAEDGSYPLMSSAIAAGLYHPRCKDAHSTYFEGISTPPDDVFSEDEIEEIKEEYLVEQKQGVAKRNYEKYSRLADATLDDNQKEKYEERTNYWYGEYSKYYKQHNAYKTDKLQFDKYRMVLSDLSPANIEEFREIKYNDKEKWNQLKYQYRTLNRYEIEGNITAQEILELDNIAWYTKQTGFDFTKLSGRERDSVKNMRNGGNAAVIKRENGDVLFAHSRLDSTADSAFDVYDADYELVLLKEQRQFEVLDLNDGIPREVDTEAKFFEELATVLPQNSNERIVLLSEKHMCKSCKHVMAQFKEKFPNVEIVLVHGKKGYNGSEDGLKTWKFRKRVKRNDGK